MTGTEKQIKWAEDIKATAIRTLENNINNMKQKNESGIFNIDIRAFEETKAYIEKQFQIMTEAKQVIEKRDRLCSACVLKEATEYAMYLRNKEAGRI